MDHVNMTKGQLWTLLGSGKLVKVVFETFYFTQPELPSSDEFKAEEKL